MGETPSESPTTEPVWTPPPEATTHAGYAFPPDTDFFHPPPAEIGKVVSAYSSLSRKTRLLDAPTVGWLVIIGVGMALAATQVVRGIGAHPLDRATGKGMTLMASIALAGLLILMIVVFVRGISQRCTYVGTQGIARYRIRGTRRAKPKVDVFLFHRAAYLKTRQVNRYRNGAYTSTEYQYSWHDQGHAGLFCLAGKHRDGEALPEATDPFHFALAAERAWSEYLFPGVQAQVAKHGLVRFLVLERSGAIRGVSVGPAFVEFEFGSGVERVQAEDFGTVRITGGEFSFKHKDARWFSGKGKFSFRYASLGNAQLFLLCLSRLAGVSPS